MSTDESSGPVEESSESAAPIDSGMPRSGFSRRTFLKAAALGTAAAALLNRDALGNLDFGATSAFADDLSSLGCTANDVQLTGAGRILNEPCNCAPGSPFTASVAFPIFNNASSSRNCVELHLCPATATITGSTSTSTVTFSNTGFVPLTDSIPGKTTATVTATLSWFCGAGDVCFGSPVTLGGGGNPICPTGACCTVITWRVPGEDTNCSNTIRFIKSKCGMPGQVCIVGRSAALGCATNGNCSPTCGGVSTLVASQTGGTGPYIFSLTGDGSQTVSSSIGATVSFTVTTSTTTTYTVKANSGDCTRTLTTALTATPLGALTPTAPNTASCAGVACVTASVSGATTYTVTDGTTTASGTSTVNCFTYTPGVATQTVTFTAVASNAAGCPSSGTVTSTVNPQLVVSLGNANTPGTCAALSSSTVTFTASASGGSGSGFTFQYVITGGGTTSTAAATGTTLVLAPNPDANCYTIAVTATDSASCPSSNTATASVKQCVSTSFSC
ncbi:MAG TPA: twin-arginine translocation signal domain-containing protein [Chloroflexota bacterium]